MAAEKTLKDLTNAVYKIAENSPKIQKDVKDIRDAICGTDSIMASLQTISKSLENTNKKDNISRISGRKSGVIDKRTILKNTNSITSLLGKILSQVQRLSSGGSRRLSGRPVREQSIGEIKNLESISKSVEITERLNSIKLKDFIFARKKMSIINKIISRSLNLFRNFKNQKEVDGTLNFVESSINLTKKLSKISLLSKPAQMGVKVIEKIMLGKKERGGLLNIFRKISSHKKQIERGKKSINDIFKSCGSILLTSIVLSGIAVIGIPAMLGALAVKGIVLLLLGTFKLLSKSRKHITKGSAAFLIMSASIITFSLGLIVMTKAVKNLQLKDIGLMMASIAGVGLTVAGIGLLSVPIAIGSASLLLIGASIGILGLSLKAWQKFDSKKSMNNIKSTIGGLKDVFGLDLGNGDNKKPPIKRIGGKILDIGLSILDFGKSFFTMGSLLLAGGALGLLFKGLKPWDNYNGGKAASNIKVAVGALKEAFGLDGKGVNKPTKRRFGGKLLDIGTSLLEMGKTFVEMGTIVVATAMMDIIRLTLIPWGKYNARPAAENMKVAFSSLKDAFGLDNKDGKKPNGKPNGGLHDLVGLATSVLQMGGTFVKMGTLVFATAMMDIIRLTLKPWESYNASASIGNMKIALSGLTDAFGLESNTTIRGNIRNATTNLFDLGSGLLNMGTTFTKMGTLLIITGSMGKIREHLDSWKNFDTGNSVGKISETMKSLMNIFGVYDDTENKSNGFLKNIGKSVGRSITNLFSLAENLSEKGSKLTKLSNLVKCVASMDKIRESLSAWNSLDATKPINSMNNALRVSVDSINSLNMEKASKLTEVFKSFKGIGNKPFDKFTAAVKQFSKSCDDLIVAIKEQDSKTTNVIETQGQGTNTPTSVSGGININNSKDLANAIAEAIKSIPVNVENNLSDIKLVVNNEVGRRIVLTLEN